MLQVAPVNRTIESDAADPKAYAAYVFGLIVTCCEPGAAASRYASSFMYPACCWSLVRSVDMSLVM